MFLIVVFIFGYEWKRFWKEILKPQIPQEIESYQNLDCILIYENKQKWKIFHYFFQLTHYRMIIFIQNIHINSNYFIEEKNKNKLILLILDNLKINVNQIIKFFPKIDSYKIIKIYHHLKVHYLYLK